MSFKDLYSQMTEEEKEQYNKLRKKVKFNGDLIHDAEELHELNNFGDRVFARIALGRKPTNMELVEYARNKRIHDEYMDKEQPVTEEESRLMKELGQTDFWSEKLKNSDGEFYRHMGKVGIGAFRNYPEEMRKYKRKKKPIKPKSKRKVVKKKKVCRCKS